MSEAGKAFGGFVEAMDRAQSVEEVRNTFLQATAHIGFDHVALFTCAHGGNQLQRAISFSRIPMAWLERYFERRYYEIDPVFEVVRRRVTPFSWNEVAYRRDLSHAQKAMLAESDEAGMVDGVAIPIRGAGAPPSCCSLVPGRGGVDPLSYHLAHSLAVFTHAQAWRLLSEQPGRSDSRLFPRERECLLLAAQGKSDWAISELLGISERTVHHAIERTKKRYGVATRVQAIVHAIAAGEFSAMDAMACGRSTGSESWDPPPRG